MTEFDDPNVERAFAAFPEDIRARLMTIREMIFEVADAEQVGALEETLKWGQPAYLTPETKAGSTIRLGQNKADEPAVFTHCQTTIVSDFRQAFPDTFEYEENRALYPGTADSSKDEALAMFVKSALTYHRSKR